jgi:flagellar protein FliO/FliZ
MLFRPTDLTPHSRVPLLCTGGICGLVLVALSEPSLAQTAAAEPPGVSGTAILQMLLGLTLIIGILFSGAYFLRKLNGGRSFGNTGPLRVVGGLMISARERIVLIEVGDAWIVVGVVPGQIKTLHTLPKGELPLAKDNARPFSQWLKQITEHKNEHN